jgi:hypothetical protein
MVRDQLRGHPDVTGVVLLGGYDVVPAQRVDCLPPAIRQALPSTGDPDDCIVWNDDAYGDVDDDKLPELPVSRIPDGRSAELVRTALQARPDSRGKPRFGVRNSARPFAEVTYGSLPGTEPMLVSAPSTFNQPVFTLDADRVYLMLHGDAADATRFWGEGTPGHTEAVNLGNIPAPAGPVVFTGCCWGALTVDTPAARVQPNQPVTPRTPDTSIALSFLRSGAVAFVGCTGAHYSPSLPPYTYFGGPLHAAFWQHSAAGDPPARALLQAKIDFGKDMPHGQAGPLAQAIEFKLLREYTCLGLGW